MCTKRIGSQPPRYSFILNPYSDVRVSKCPRRRRPTYARKFALFIHVDGFGPLVLGKTCRNCARCELIVAHQDELEAQLASATQAGSPSNIKPGCQAGVVFG